MDEKKSINTVNPTGGYGAGTPYVPPPGINAQDIKEAQRRAKSTLEYLVYKASKLVMNAVITILKLFFSFGKDVFHEFVKIVTGK